MTVNARKLFLDACSGKPVPRPPVWLMRQVGRYMDKYQALRSRLSFIELITQPRAATEATLIALDDLDPDALIIFSDILPVLAAMGAEIAYQPKLSVAADINSLETSPRESWLSPAWETVREVKKAAKDEKAILGFAGAPFTLFYYLMDKSARARSFLLSDEKRSRTLLQQIARVVALHLRRQIEAGADAVQLFDSHAAELSPDLYSSFALPALKIVLEELAPLNVPVILFARGRNHIDHRDELEGNIFSIDWTVAFSELASPETLTIQGNLDPAVFFAGAEATHRETKKMLAQSGSFGGYIANLGHGVLPETPMESVREFIRTVKTFTKDSS